MINCDVKGSISIIICYKFPKKSPKRSNFIEKVKEMSLQVEENNEET